jgi:UDP-N-acetylmuramoyl-L-alanyl-D-glutamate--2,6-diaminopimelate ligase
MQEVHQISEILQNWPIQKQIGSADITVSNLCFDSRKVNETSLFFAIPGIKTDGHQYLEAVVKMGCRAVVVEQIPHLISEGVTYIQVKDTRECLGYVSGHWYDHPSQKLTLIGVTGTNGKTTLVTLLHQLFSSIGFKTGLISTIENIIGQDLLPSSYTTPDILTINQLLSQMVDFGCQYAFMEVSSHALVQKRTYGLHFAGAVFTNITRDHLDYHTTFNDYIKAKKLLFDYLPPSSFALVNADDKHSKVMVQNTKASVITYALHAVSDYKGRILSNSLTGMELDLNGASVHIPLFGTFNASNLLAVYATALQLYGDKEEILTHLSMLRAPKGRLDTCMSPNRAVMGIVDYAHTPDALEKLLEVLLPLREKKGKLILVVGCGGDRDKGKRPLMGKIAVKWSDLTIFTADNPRTEEINDILNEMEGDLTATELDHVLRIEDRKMAIKTAVKLAVSGDVIVVAGKGHENYQEIKGERREFDDKIELTNALSSIV